MRVVNKDHLDTVLFNRATDVKSDMPFHLATGALIGVHRFQELWFVDGNGKLSKLN